MEDLARIPVDVDLASEFRYRRPILSPKTLVVIISQSGETADSLAALREAHSHGNKVLGIVNGGGFLHCPGVRLCVLYQCGAGDRRRHHQGLFHPDDRRLPLGHPHRAGPRGAGRGTGGEPSQTAGRRCRARSAGCWKKKSAFSGLPASTPRPRIRSSSAGASTTPSPWRAAEAEGNQLYPTRRLTPRANSNTVPSASSRTAPSACAC